MLRTKRKGVSLDGLLTFPWLERNGAESQLSLLCVLLVHFATWAPFLIPYGWRQPTASCTKKPQSAETCLVSVVWLDDLHKNKADETTRSGQLRKKNLLHVYCRRLSQQLCVLFCSVLRALTVKKHLYNPCKVELRLRVGTSLTNNLRIWKLLFPWTDRATCN